MEGTQPPLGLPGGWILIKLLMTVGLVCRHRINTEWRERLGRKKRRISNLIDALCFRWVSWSVLKLTRILVSSRSLASCWWRASFFFNVSTLTLAQFASPCK